MGIISVRIGYVVVGFDYQVLSEQEDSEDDSTSESANKDDELLALFYVN